MESESKSIERLSSTEWEAHYNPSMVNNLVDSIKDEHLSSQTAEMLKLTRPGDRVLEIGSGSGATSLFLAKNGRKVTAFDYAESCLELTKQASLKLGYDVETVFGNAEQTLSFPDDSFDMVFQAGLLEHYEREERLRLLKIWGKVGKRMVSIIPNASSLAYRVGKARAEKNGTWAYGKELPQYSLVQEFAEAGFKVTNEYTIGLEHSLNFLPKWHYLRLVLKLWMKNNNCEDDCHQGYLLVTVGERG